MTRFDTKLAHLGRTSARQQRSVNPPLVRASTTLFETVAEMREARAGVPYETARYGIYGTATTFELQTAMAELCETESCIATASGLSAIAATLAAHAQPGSRILIERGIYEPTRQVAASSSSVASTSPLGSSPSGSCARSARSSTSPPPKTSSDSSTSEPASSSSRFRPR